MSALNAPARALTGSQIVEALPELPEDDLVAVIQAVGRIRTALVGTPARKLQRLTPEIIAQSLALLAAASVETPDGWRAIQRLSEIERTIRREDIPAFCDALSGAFENDVAE